MEEIIENSTKRGSNGGKKRAEKLSKEERKSIASAAAKARWAKKKNNISSGNAIVVQGSEPITSITMTPAPLEPIVVTLPDENHCPACVAGQSLEEGEGTHILATIEHPVVLPAAFADAETVIAVAEPPAPPQKPPKRQSKPMPKEFKSASSYAEKRLPQAIKEKSDHVGAVARLEAEINDLVKVIKALGGTVDHQAIQPQRYPSPTGPYQEPAGYGTMMPPFPAQYQSNIPTATQVDIPSSPKPMRAGGAGALEIFLND